MAAVDMTDQNCIMREVVGHLRRMPLHLAGLRHQGLLFETYQRKLRRVWDSMGVPPPQVASFAPSLPLLLMLFIGHIAYCISLC